MSSGERSRTPSRERNRRESHSTSYTRSRKNSYSDDSYSDYSDSFYTEDEESKKSTLNRGKRQEKKTNNRTAARGRGKPVLGRNSKAQALPKSSDYITKRMLSARRMKINELRSENENLLQQVAELQKENKTLLRQQRITDKQLERYEGQESEVPQLIKRHTEEIRVLREQLRRQKEKYHKTEKKRNETDDELSRTKRLLKKMKGLVEDKELKERDELSQKLSKLESEVDEKTRKIEQLEHHIENLTKNHRHELGIERARHKETELKLRELSVERQNLKMTLKEKEKELEIKNIYSNRIMRPPHKLNSSVSSSPIPETGRPPRPRQRKNSTPSNMTPRERAKLFEEQRREEMRRAREHTQKVNNRSLQQHVVRPSVSNEHSPNHDEQNLSSKKPVKLIQQHERNIRSRDDKIEQTREHSQGRGGHIKFSFQTYEGKHPSKSFVEKKTELGQSYQHGGSIAENYHNSGTEIRYSPRWGSVMAISHIKWSKKGGKRKVKSLMRDKYGEFKKKKKR
ncbi:hypothetical protein LSH36_150g02011 [Paralvinella palmiformis]|uniref:Lebercilin domain-containing protein n=1 Tax=Paralvinella palmiformis TaxID=53620 RepID=A0AAD9JUX5_9ANNE|nr:hypothetical protein LSH36_150g02011 [Paralvinella palmiformis]